VSRSHIHWGRAIGGMLIAEVGQIAAAFGWVAIYSFLINPGLDAPAYQAYAQVASPWVAIIAGAPIFYAAARWIARNVPTALALFALFAVVDGALAVASGGPFTGLAMAQIALSYATKLVACWLGGTHAVRAM
jgi:hypothetical protein